LDPTLYTIVPANSSQAQQHALATYAPWGRGLDWETYCKLGSRGRTEGEWRKGGEVIVWVLVRWDDLQGDIYAGCETYRRKGLLKRQGTSIIQETSTYNVASVVTPVSHRCNGYATHLLRLLHYMIGPPESLPPFPIAWGRLPPRLPADVQTSVPRSLGSILWSDVGSSFYAKCTIGLDRPGWVTHWAQNHQISFRLRDPGPLPASIQWIYESDLPAVGAELLKATRAALSSADTRDHSILLTDPSSPGLLRFVPARGQWLDETLSGQVWPVRPVGMRISHGGAGDAIVLFALRCAMINDQLLLTCTHNVQPAHLPDILSALDVAAAMTGRTEAFVWGLEPESDGARMWMGIPGRDVRQARRAERMDNLLGCAWYGEGKGVITDGQMCSWA